jgi:hypothetical protein
MYAWRFDLQIPLVHGCQQTVRYVVLPTIDPSTGREFVLSAGPRERWLQCLQNSNGDSSSKSLRIPLTALNANIDGSLLIQQLNDNPSVNRFYLPAANTSMHWLFGSCNGQSQTDEGMSYSKPSDPGINRAVGWKHRMLCDIRRKHESEQPFHLMVGAGDQIYLDGLFHRENCPSVADWLEQMRKIGFTDDSTEQTKGITNSISERTRFIHDQSAVTPEMLAELERFIFTSYCNHFMEVCCI